MRAPAGFFLVRGSETFVGDYILSFWHNEKVQHCRIHWWQDSSIHGFFLTDNQVFGSLYDFITNYWEMALRYNRLEADKAGVSVQHSQQHRLGAVGWHMRDKPSSSTLSFRAGWKTQHCHMQQEGHT